MQTKTRIKVFSLGASSFIMIMANTMLLPVFPQMRKALDLSLQEISLLFILVSFPAALLNPVGGLLADRWGRKKIVVPSIILYGLAGGLAGVAILLLENPYYTVLFFRLLQGIGSATPMYLAVALAGDIFQSQERNRAMGLIETANGLGKLFSPIIGGTVGLLGWYAPFFVYPLISLPVALCIWFFIQEPPVQEKVSVRSELRSLHQLKERSYMLTLLVSFVSIFFLIATLFWVSELIEGIYPEGTFIHGLVISVPVAAYVLTALLASGFTAKIGPRLTIFGGLLIAGISLTLIPLLQNSFFLWPNLVLVGFSSGLLLPVTDTVATTVSAKGHRGIITTIFGSFRCLGSAAAPYLVATLMQISIALTFLPLAALGFALSFSVYFLVNEEKMLPPELKEK